MIVLLDRWDEKNKLHVIGHPLFFEQTAYARPTPLHGNSMVNLLSVETAIPRETNQTSAGGDLFVTTLPETHPMVHNSDTVLSNGVLSV